LYLVAEPSRRRDPRRWLLAAEAATALLNSYAQMRLLPFRRVAVLHGLTPDHMSSAVPDAGTAVDVEPFGWAVRAVSRRTPWTSTCLMQALAGATMLRRRGVPCTVHLGVASAGAGYDAHAWLSVGDHVLTGQSGMEHYIEVGRYAHPEG
jgi:hypothetical protein